MSKLATQNLPPELTIQQTTILEGPPRGGIIYEEGFGSKGSNSLPNRYRWAQRAYGYSSTDPFTTYQNNSGSIVKQMLQETGDAGISATIIRRTADQPTTNTIYDEGPRRGYQEMKAAADAGKLSRRPILRDTVQTRSAVVGAMRANRVRFMAPPSQHIGAGVSAQDASSVPLPLRILAAQKEAARHQEAQITKVNAQYHPSEIQSDGTVRPDRVQASIIRKQNASKALGSESSGPGGMHQGDPFGQPYYADGAKTRPSLLSRIFSPSGGSSSRTPIGPSTSMSSNGTTYTEGSGSSANESLMQYGADAANYGLTETGEVKKSNMALIVGAVLVGIGGLYLIAKK